MNDPSDPLITPRAPYRALGVQSVDPQRAYRALFGVHPDTPTIDFVRRVTNDGTVLGSDRFCERTEAATKRRVRKLTHGGDRRSNAYREGRQNWRRGNWFQQLWPLDSPTETEKQLTFALDRGQTGCVQTSVSIGVPVGRVVPAISLN